MSTDTSKKAQPEGQDEECSNGPPTDEASDAEAAADEALERMDRGEADDSFDDDPDPDPVPIDEGDEDDDPNIEDTPE